MRVVLAAALAAALAACGQQQPAEKTASVQPAASLPPQVAPVTSALRAQDGVYYMDFVRASGMERFAIEQLGLPQDQAARFSRSMDVQTPSRIVTSNGVEALVFVGCMAHNCPNGTSVIAIDTATGDLFAGVKDEEGETILRPNARLQMLLTQTSPTQAWSDPVRG
ncbi:MAG: hypothetical protein AB7J28_14190 [Hyphomonadaceae bacterium]